MVSASDCRKGVKILYKGEPHAVYDYQHVKPGKGAAFVRLRLKNLSTGLMKDVTARPDEKFEKPDLEYRHMQYLYNDGDLYVFMDQEEFEQVELNKHHIQDVEKYLKEQVVYTMLYWDGTPIDVTPPLHMELEVTETPPGVRGDTAQGGTKQATLETGYVVSVPLFVNEGDVVKVDTRDGTYIERV